MNSKAVLSPRGTEVTLYCRDDTSDLATIGSTWSLWGELHDEYELQWVRSTGLMIDVGAHIGSVCIAFLVDNPEARAIAIEPLPENLDMIAMNAASAGVTDRLTVLPKAVGDGKPTTIRYGNDVHEFIGNIRGSEGPIRTVPTLTFRQVVNGQQVDLMKIDCEGGEWPFFASAKPADLKRVKRIVGEYHHEGSDRLLGYLEGTHDVSTVGADTGLFRAVVR